jgi:hypothetical protein
MNMTLDKKIGTKSLRVSTRFNHVIFPLDMVAFANLLAANGYKLMEPPPPPEPTSIVRLAYAGPMASKEGVVVDGNNQAQFVGVTSSDPERLISSFDEVLRMLDSRDILGGPLKAWFTELQAHFEYWPPESPVQILGRIGSDCGVLRNLETILEKKCCFRELRVVPESIDPDSPDFFEIVMQPSPGRPSSSFEILIIFRNQNLDTVRDFARNIGKTVERLVDSL